MFYAPRDTSAALALCNVCPVTQECLSHAMATEDRWRGRSGIFGGLVPNQREALARGELNHPGMWCLTCGRHFFAASLRATFCSAPCGQAAARARERLRAAGVASVGRVVGWHHPGQQKAPAG